MKGIAYIARFTGSDVGQRYSSIQLMILARTTPIVSIVLGV